MVEQPLTADEQWEPPEWIDRTLPVDGEAKAVTGREVLMAAARMQRDGKSLRYIRRELGLLPRADIDDRTLQNALNLGHQLLEWSIRKGVEPEESRIRVAEADDFVLYGPDGRPL